MEWLTNLFSRKPTSKQIAKDRLLLVLSHDRVNCSDNSATLEMLKNDIIKVIASYYEMDTDDNDFKIEISRGKNENNELVPVIYANIPIKKMRKQPQ